MAVFFETPVFTRRVTALLSDDEYAELQKVLVAAPNAGDLIPGSGGFAKSDGRSRVAASAAERASSTTILSVRDQFYMLLIYGKNEQDDLSPSSCAC